MTVKDLMDNIPPRKDWGKVDALAEGRCGHCGFENDRGKYSYFCSTCYYYMSLGDDEPLLGLAEATTRGKVNKDLLREEFVDRKIIDSDENAAPTYR
jgi:hypothetical protein